MAPHNTNPSSPQNTTPLFFWLTNEKPYGVFSQWHKTPFTDPTQPTLTFHTAETYMMHSKAILFSDQSTATKILAAKTPKQHKTLGRQVSNFNEKIWEQQKLAIVERGNYLKFTQNEELKALLLATGERELVEASSQDEIWGIGFNRAKAMQVSRNKWGMNLLGIALMNVREKIRTEEAGKHLQNSSDGKEDVEKARKGKKRKADEDADDWDEEMSSKKFKKDKSLKFNEDETSDRFKRRNHTKLHKNRFTQKATKNSDMEITKSTAAGSKISTLRADGGGVMISNDYVVDDSKDESSSNDSSDEDD